MQCGSRDRKAHRADNSGGSEKNINYYDNPKTVRTMFEQVSHQVCSCVLACVCVCVLKIHYAVRVTDKHARTIALCEQCRWIEDGMG